MALSGSPDFLGVSSSLRPLRNTFAFFAVYGFLTTELHGVGTELHSKKFNITPPMDRGKL